MKELLCSVTACLLIILFLLFIARPPHYGQNWTAGVKTLNLDQQVLVITEAAHHVKITTGIQLFFTGVGLVCGTRQTRVSKQTKLLVGK